MVFHVLVATKREGAQKIKLHCTVITKETRKCNVVETQQFARKCADNSTRYVHAFICMFQQQRKK